MQIFEKIKIKNLKYLIGILDKKNSLDVIESIYSRAFTNFNLHLNFLIDLKILEHNSLKKNFIKNTINISNLEIEILDALKLDNSEIGEIYREFLRKFKKTNGTYKAFFKDMEEAQKYMHLRIFLYDMRVLSDIDFPGFYEINSIYEKHIFKNILSLEAFKRRLQEKEHIGENAELEVMKYERKKIRMFKNLFLRKRPSQEFEVNQISKINVSAGYDIESWMYESGKMRNIFIEVKAVSQNEPRFHWSMNEIIKAKELASSYYLYLLPVTGKNQLDLEFMEIIQNPYKNIIENSNEWTKEAESYIVSRR